MKKTIGLEAGRLTEVLVPDMLFGTHDGAQDLTGTGWHTLQPWLTVKPSLCAEVNGGNDQRIEILRAGWYELTLWLTIDESPPGPDVALRIRTRPPGGPTTTVDFSGAPLEYTLHIDDMPQYNIRGLPVEFVENERFRFQAMNLAASSEPVLSSGTGFRVTGPW